MPKAPLTLVVVAGGRAPAASRIYEDAGEGYEHLRGASRTTTAAVDGNSVKLSRSGSYNSARSLASIEFLGVTSAPREARAGGRPAAGLAFDAAAGRATVPIPPGGADEISIIP